MNKKRLVKGRRYKYTEWDKNNNSVICEYVGSKESIDGTLYTFKYSKGTMRYFTTLYPSKLENIHYE